MRVFRFWPSLKGDRRSCLRPKTCRAHEAPRRRREKTSGTQRIACVQTLPSPQKKSGRESPSPRLFFFVRGEGVCTQATQRIVGVEGARKGMTYK